MARKFIAVCGPTASGKSELSIALAQRIQAEVISIDASQAVRGADVGTAKISPAERELCTHHLLDIVEPNQKMEAGFFLERLKPLLDAFDVEKKLPILCVGTTMYLGLFLEGLAGTGVADIALRRSLETLESQTLYSRLQGIDPQRAAALHPNDRLRVIRALEIHATTGSAPSKLYSQQHRPEVNCGLFIVLCWPRERLAERIDARVERMLQAGLIEECRGLVAAFGTQAPIFNSIGYAETLAYLEGHIDASTLSDEIKTHTKQLAKKQMTFLRRFALKHGFNCEPKQESELNLEVVNSRQRSKRLKQGLQFSTLSLDFNELLGEVRAHLSDAQVEPRSKVLYVDARILLESIPVAPLAKGTLFEPADRQHCER